MGKIKVRLSSMPLRKSFIMIILVMAFLVAGFSAVTIFVCLDIQQKLLDSVTVVAKDYATRPDNEYNVIISDDRYLSQGEDGQLVVLSTEYRIDKLTDAQKILYYCAKIAVIAIPTFLFVIGTVLCAWIFYSCKLKEPLAVLTQSAERISQNELDFDMTYESKDEMGNLCQAINLMRLALAENNQKMWDMMEERRKLSASIAHDLRTPITVIRGYSEYLTNHLPAGRLSEEKILSTAHNLSLAAKRLEQYVNQVRDVQALDAVPLNYSFCNLQDYFEEIQDEYFLYAQEQNAVNFTMDAGTLPNVCVLMDATLVHRILDNTISNAVRYASSSIKLTVTLTDTELTMTIADDGIGFSQEALKSATKPFYKENSENGHYGLGLSICNTLCQKHGGYLQIDNQGNGGACITVNIKIQYE